MKSVKKIKICDNKKETKLRIIKSILYAIYSFAFKNLGGWYIRNTYRSIKNIIRWTPILWKDRDWDQSYIYDILKFKLNNQAIYINKYNRHETSNRDAEIIRTCVRLITKIEDGFYETEYYDYQYSQLDIINEKYLSKRNFNVNSERFDEYFAKYPSVYRKMLSNPEEQKLKLNLSLSEINNKKRMAMNIATYNQTRAKHLLFKLIEENIDGWWD